VVPLPHMPFWEICRGPVTGGEVEVAGGVVEAEVDELVGGVVTGGGVEMLVLVGVEVEDRVVVLEVGAAVEVGEGRGSPSHQPNWAWQPTIWGQYWSPSPQ